MSAVLVLAGDDDLHADGVFDRLRQLGVRVERIDPEGDWAPRDGLSLRVGADGVAGAIRLGSRSLELGEIGAVFCRSWSFRRPAESEPFHEHLRAHEMRAGLAGLMRCLRSRFWINEPWLEEPVDSKMFQAMEAIRFGLPIPETLATTDPDEAVDFHRRMSGRVVIKQLSEVSLVDAAGGADGAPIVHGFFTEPVPEEVLRSAAAEIRNAPCLLQERVEKAADLRITVVGDRIFGHRIRSQDDPAAREDFRRGLGLPHSTCELAAPIADRLRAMLRSWGIHFAACDFVERLDGEVVFLEANVTGNWLWLEGPGEFPIVDSIVADLAAAAERHRHAPR